MHPSRIQYPVNSEHRTIIGIPDNRLAPSVQEICDDAQTTMISSKLTGDGWGAGRGFYTLYNGDGVLMNEMLDEDGDGRGSGVALAW